MEMVRIGVVAPRSFRAEDEYKNAERAQAYVKEAADNGAQLICFPEGYPGPCSGPMDSGGHLDKIPIEMMRESAKRHRVYISCGNLEESAEIKEAYYLCHKLISPQGAIIANYKRCQPTPPALNSYLYNGRSHLLPGNEPIVVDTELGKIGLIICSELWVPELSRIEMLMGARIILDPIGGTHSRTRAQRYDESGSIRRGSKMAIWQCIAQTRAVENMVYVVGTANVFFDESPWGSFVAGPDGLIVASEGEGISSAVLDMQRLESLRNRAWEETDLQPPPDDLTVYRPLSCQPGQNRDRRPELYSKLVDHQIDAFNFSYYTKDGEFS